MGPGNELSIAGDQLVRGGRGLAAQVIHAFEDNHVGRAGYREDVAIESTQGALAEDGDDAVADDTIAADAGIVHADRATWKTSDQPFRQPVGPAAVCACRGLIAVSDGIAEGHDHRRGRGRGLDIDFGQEGAVLRAGAAGRNRLLREISRRRDVDRFKTAHMAGTATGVSRQVDADAQAIQGLDGQGDGVADKGCARRNRRRGRPGKGDRPVTAGDCCAIRADQGYARAADVQSPGPVLVCQADSQALAAGAETDDLRHGLIVEGRRSARRVVGGRRHGRGRRGGPAADPMGGAGGIGVGSRERQGADYGRQPHISGSPRGVGDRSCMTAAT